jgi:hypothetical protein
MKKLILLLVVTIIILSCEKENIETDFNAVTSTENLKGVKSKLQLDFTGLSPLGPHYRYEGWIIVNGEPVSTGKFNITPAGVMAPNVFNVNEAVLAGASTFVLTIEPHPDPDSSPASTHVLAGNFEGSSANLSIDHGAALGTDFSSSAGVYILATPTTSTMNDELSGIWFLDLSSGSPEEGLSLPVLPSGWVYEGWTVINGKPVTSGKFFDVDDFDLDDPYSSNENPGPPFPGEDYIVNAPRGLSFPTDLSGGIAVISVEPYPDNGPEPYALKPLVGEIPVNAEAHFNYSLVQNPGSFPTGMAKR